MNSIATMTRTRLATLISLSAFAIAATPAHAGKGPRYSYGQPWWLEYTSDKETALLLHFGPPTASAGEHLVKKLEAQKKEDELLSPESVKSDAGGKSPGPELPSISIEDMKLAVVDDRNVPVDTVLDYSDARRRLTLGEGLAVIPGGRFGAGLQCTGKGALKTVVQNPAMGECSFRIAAYPARTNCLMSFADDEARLVLRPDGRLELKLRKPHGIPNAKRLAPEAIQALMQKDASVVSPEPMPTNEWVHVAIWNKPHPAPGDTSPFDARLTVNGTDVAWFMSEGGNHYQEFLGRQATPFVLGNNASGTEGFTGQIDEVRVSAIARDLYERPAMPWRDAAAARPLQFDRPFFRSDGTVFHASLDKGLKLDRDSAGAGDIQVDLHGNALDGILVDGIRGRGWLMDPDIGFARVPLKGMTARAGALEFWLRPVNWDDLTGYWQHSPPDKLHLSVARLVTRDTSGAEKPVFNVTLPRAFNLERARVPVDPGHWLHMALVWDEGGWGLFVNDKVISGARREPGVNLDAGLAYAEFGVSDRVTGADGKAPRIEIDEVVGYRSHLRADEVAQAHKRWMGKLDPIPLYNDSFQYKWSLSKLEFELIPLLPEGVVPASCRVALHDMKDESKPLIGPLESTKLDKDAFRFVLSEGKPLPYGRYQFRFEVRDPQGKAVAEGRRDWKFEEEPWRNCRAGILDKTPPPWTPIRAEGRTVATRMTAYTLGDDGLPAQIRADGEDILAAPFHLTEDDQPLAGKMAALGPSRDVDADWESAFSGKTCDIAVKCRAEYDGMIRYELALKPKGKVARLSFVMPLKAAYAKRMLYYPMGDRGVSTGTIGTNDAKYLESRVADFAPKVWRDYVQARDKDPGLKWETFWEPIKEKHEGYGFFGHVDINDMNRGLFWFCDNAAGWWQSPKVSAIEIVRKGEVVSLVLNLVAEPVEYASTRPIVFGILPHPARPVPEKYRLFNRVSSAEDPRACDIYDAFYPWAMDPRDHSMKLYPAVDPKRPEAGPSWDYAERCSPLMKATKPKGLRTMYLSRAWFSCRAGAYDGWEWRSGTTSEASLTPYFNNYLCWEMNEWIGRDIWDAIYLDECYEEPAENLEAGFSVLLPDGKPQLGVCNFMFRDLMKRWRNIFTAHGKEPMLIAHHTHSWQYQGLVFCESCLDGENSPIVSLQSRDWIDSTSKERFEAIQNARLWGISTFYMPFIAEGGFDNKEKSQFPRWQWRMARQAQSEFAHYETATVYEGQGSQVYKAYWKDLLGWGAGPTSVTFHPYWDNAKYVQAEGQGGDTLVSFYRKPGGVLLIASNRRKADCTVRVALDLAALGLKSPPAAKSLDGSFEPAAGDDFTGAASVEKETRQLLEKADLPDMRDKPDDKQVEDLLANPDEAEAKRRAAWAPRFEGATLIVPVRAKDYRVITLE